MLKVVEEGFRSEEGALPRDLDGLAREGARRMLAVALELEVEAYLAKHAGADVEAKAAEAAQERCSSRGPVRSAGRR